MASDRFPYDKHSFEAFVMLLQITRPKWRVEPRNVVFGTPIFTPTPTSPGRTYIEVNLLDQGIKTPFYYRRLDIGIALGKTVRVRVEGDITSRKIVEQLNLKRNMYFGPEDVFMTDKVLGLPGETLTYRMTAKTGSLVWYGSTIIEVLPPAVSVNARLLEDGTTRLMEDGTPRLLER